MYGLLLDEIELGNLPNSCKGFRCPAKRRLAKKGPTGKRRKSAKTKKTKKVVKKTSIRKNAVHKQQPHGLANRDDILYMGFQHHGGRDEVLEVVLDSVLRKYLLQFGISVEYS